MKNNLKLGFLVLLLTVAFFSIQRKKAVTYPEIPVRPHSEVASNKTKKVLLAKDNVFSAVNAVKLQKAKKKIAGANKNKGPSIQPLKVDSGLKQNSKSNVHTKKPVKKSSESDELWDRPNGYSDSLVLRENFFKAVLAVDDHTLEKIYEAEQELLSELVDIHDTLGQNPHENVIQVDERVTNDVLDHFKLEVETHLTRSQVKKYIEFLKENKTASNFKFKHLFFDSSVLIRALSENHGNAEIITEI